MEELEGLFSADVPQQAVLTGMINAASQLVQRLMVVVFMTVAKVQKLS